MGGSRMQTIKAAGWIDGLTSLNACKDAVTWAQTHPPLVEAWAAYERADWMLWLLGQLSGEKESADRKRLVLCACACARTVLKYVPASEGRPLVAIETAE